MQEIKWERLAAILVSIALGVVALGLFFRYLLPILFPFLIAWLLSLIIRPVSARLHRATGIPKKLWAVLLLILFLSGIVLLVGFSVSRALEELRRLVSRLLEEQGGVRGFLEGSVRTFEDFCSRSTFLSPLGGEEGAAFREEINGMLVKLIEGMVTSLGDWLPRVAARILSALPGAFLMMLVIVISGFYLCLDGERITSSLLNCLPSFLSCRLTGVKQWAKRISFRYVKAYLLLLFLVFSLLFVGFSVLRIEYAFLFAALVAVVDLLPVLGVGTVLIPWAAISLIQKNYYLGFGLIILYLAVFVLRQILEPRLVGRSLGLHPLITLFASYAGLRLFGFLGMMLGPIVAMLISLLPRQLDSKGQDADKL